MSKISNSLAVENKNAYQWLNVNRAIITANVPKKRDEKYNERMKRMSAMLSWNINGI